MFIFDSLQEILFTLSKNKLRSGLTAFGVFWGIFLLILLLGAGKGLQNGVESGFEGDAQDTVSFWARKTSIPFEGLKSGRHIHLTLSDVEAIKRDVDEVAYVSAERRFNGPTFVSYADRSGSFEVFGIADDFFRVKSGVGFIDGRELNYFDNSLSRKVASIGQPIAKLLFKGGGAIGKYISINKVEFLVVSVFEDDEGNGRNGNRIYIPSEVFSKIFSQGKTTVSGISYRVKKAYDSKHVENKVHGLLKKRHRISPEDNAAIRVNNVAETKARVDSLFGGITAFIWFVGVGTLAAGIVGISNIMLITVKERTVEIGIRKALGARPINIIFSLLLESIFITSVAGYVGLVVGVGFIELVNYLLTTLAISSEFFKNPEVDFYIAIQAILILIVVGAIAGFFPAWRAARISPIEAMRSL